MSTTPLAPRSLFARWVDDAAVFPPGCSPVEVAWADHLTLRSGGYADLLGPLLVPASAVGALLEAAAQQPAGDLAPVGVTVLTRAGAPVDGLLAGARDVATDGSLQLMGVELAHDARWRRALELGVPVAVEVPRGPAGEHALDDLAGAHATRSPTPGADLAGAPVLAKLRTQATADAPAPTAQELADFVLGAVGRGLTFKLTGGLHRAVRHGERSGAEHGALNTLLATDLAVTGADSDALVAVLEERDGRRLADLARALGDEDAERVRAAYRSFGCCGVTDPLTDLEQLGLLPTP